MPQIRGAGTFLKNCKQDIKNSSLKIDHSSVKLENYKIANGLEKHLNRITLEEYRRKADADYEIKVRLLRKCALKLYNKHKYERINCMFQKQFFV